MYRRINRGASCTHPRRRTPEKLHLSAGTQVIVLSKDAPPYGKGTRVMFATLEIPKPGDRVLVQLISGAYAFEDYCPDDTKNIVGVVLAAVAPVNGGAR